LTLKNAIVSDKFIDYLEFQWQEDLSPVQLAGRFNRWLYDDEFVRKSLPDLARAGQCLLFISPLN